MLPVQQTCFWMATSARTAEPPLAGMQRADIAIIGAGFTGLWTSLFLSELDPSIQIAVVEANIAGYGGSGRNAGILGETVDHSHALAIAHFGRDEAQKLAHIGKQNVEEMAAFVAAHNIDCELELTGRLMVALTAAQREEAQRSVEIATALGVENWRFLDQNQTRAEINSPLYRGAAYAPSGGILNPVKLVKGLKRLAIARGVRFYEYSPVQSFSGTSVSTNGGTLACERVILATDAYTHHLFPRLLRYFIPLYDYILVSEPLTQTQKEEIGWRNRQGVMDGRTFFNYYRLTADDRILWGTSEAMYYPPNRVQESCDHSERHYRELEESFRRHFPQLRDLQFPYAWGGPIASTTRLTPFFGAADKDRIFYALGYTGHGIGSTRLAGKILAHMATGRPSELLELAMVRRKPFPYPPEPIRSLAVAKVTSALRKTDAGRSPGLLLKILDGLGIGFSS
jgi:glycine/D-amino acid oxidase-like deaminating enzyme